MSMVDSVATALAQIPCDARDSAARALAERYAAALDEGGELDVIGPKLLAALDALGLTPKARSATLKGGEAGAPDAGKRNPADELRARRAARLDGSASVDAAIT